ncbi:hypothetical protein JCM8547_008735 [Rhodosporidiobolus lusitaniae]
MSAHSNILATSPLSEYLPDPRLPDPDEHGEIDLVRSTPHKPTHRSAAHLIGQEPLTQSHHYRWFRRIELFVSDFDKSREFVHLVPGADRRWDGRIIFPNDPSESREIRAGEEEHPKYRVDIKRRESHTFKDVKSEDLWTFQSTILSPSNKTPMMASWYLENKHGGIADKVCIRFFAYRYHDQRNHSPPPFRPVLPLEPTPAYSDPDPNPPHYAFQPVARTSSTGLPVLVRPEGHHTPVVAPLGVEDEQFLADLSRRQASRMRNTPHISGNTGVASRLEPPVYEGSEGGGALPSFDHSHLPRAAYVARAREELKIRIRLFLEKRNTTVFRGADPLEHLSFSHITPHPISSSLASGVRSTHWRGELTVSLPGVWSVIADPEIKTNGVLHWPFRGEKGFGLVLPGQTVRVLAGGGKPVRVAVGQHVGEDGRLTFRNALDDVWTLNSRVGHLLPSHNPGDVSEQAVRSVFRTSWTLNTGDEDVFVVNFVRTHEWEAWVEGATTGWGEVQAFEMGRRRGGEERRERRRKGRRGF